MLPRPMPADQARELLRQLGWTQSMAASRLHVTKRQIQRDTAPGAVMPVARSDLLRMIAEKERERRESG